ncbi:MAG: bifunctional hydroxymethylpyrimidine kinase/phosphomethylpyrimidine kinase [Clostridia bacterium]
MSAITALTPRTQPASGIRVTPEFLEQQIDSVFTDIRPDAVKIGMVSSTGLIVDCEEAVVGQKTLLWTGYGGDERSKVNQRRRHRHLERIAFPLAAVLTPNIPEAEVLSEWKLSADDMITQQNGSVKRTIVGSLQGRTSVK